MNESPRLWLALAGIVTYYVSRTIYRLYFHPLSKIPGPKITVITGLYEFYYDVICGGRFLFQTEKMHQQYGPIVRINHREVHISDPTFYDEIYASSSRKRDRDINSYAAFALPHATIGTMDHEHHRFRRSLLNDFFSKRSVSGLSPVVEERVSKLMERLEGFYRTGQVVNINNAFAALTSDVITHYCYGKAWNFLEDEAFRSDVHKTTEENTSLAHVNRYFPFVPETTRMVPPWMLSLLFPAKSAVIEFQKSFLQHISASVQDGGGEKGSGTTNRTIFKRLSDPSLPAEERTLRRIQDEVLTLLGAGTETTASALAMMVYYLAQDRSTVDKLRAELKPLLPTPTSTASWAELEKLPYLTAVVSESLRLSYGLIMRLPRVAPTETLQYQGYVLPPGTPLSTSTWFVHRNPTIFPDPDRFDPERWIQAAARGENLSRYLVSFMRGSRACVGMNLAYIELYLTTARLVRRFEFELHDTRAEDIQVARDKIIPYVESLD
ncbi:benzoate 4-monooxygenase cytochrome P450 [Aspergillus ellipticus CBS 707.79]|uniref:Cytochrome P450 monooxygenase otaC n=1 Tax=Aspergillus ellipticus CBS 707.79 TaxID=1448320 RepID=A0A319CSJ2_9EURO|nr:benzoate 4-monooxygenase cytochrome P450 [Aspergillus ellipticus CBS 707.79]